MQPEPNNARSLVSYLDVILYNRFLVFLRYLGDAAFFLPIVFSCLAPETASFPPEPHWNPTSVALSFSLEICVSQTFLLLRGSRDCFGKIFLRWHYSLGWRVCATRLSERLACESR